MQTLGSYLREQRERRGWLQTELAARSGVPQATISAIETGTKKLPGADIRRKLATALGVRHAEFLIAAGELDEREIDPRRQPTYSDNRLQMVADNWEQLTETEKQFVLVVIEGSRRRRGFDGLDDIVAIVAETGPRRAAGGG